MVVDEKVRAGSLNHSKNVLLFVLCAIVFSLPATLLAKQNNDGKSQASSVPRYRVFSFRHITAEQAQDFLKKASIQAESQIVKDNVISITAPQQELARAAEVLRLVDSQKPFEVEITVPTAAVSSLPTAKEISSKLGNIQVGSFATPPAGQGDKAIIDISGGTVLIIAPVERIEQIEQLLMPEKQNGASRNEAEDADETLVTSLTKPVDANVVTISDFNNEAEPAVKNQTKMETNNPDLLDATALLRINAQKQSATGAGKTKKAEANLQANLDANSRPLSDVFNRLVDSLGKKGDIDSNKVAAAPAKTQVAAKVAAEARREANQPATGVQAATRGAQTYEPEPVDDGNEVISVSLPEKISIIQLIGLVSEYLHLNYMYDPTVVQGDITLKLENKLEGKLKVKDLYPLLETVMKQKGLVMTRRGNFVTIVQSKDVDSIDPALVDTTKEKIQKGDIVITRIFYIKYISAENAKNLLDGMGLGVDINTSASAAGILIVTEYAYRMDRVEELLNMVDKPGEPKRFHFRQLKYTMASNLKDKIKALAEQLGTVSITIATPAARAMPMVPGRPLIRQPVPTQPTPTPSTAPASEALNVFIDVDERTNRLLMIGREEQLNIVESLIDTLDVQQQDLRSLRIYQIQNADAQDVVSKLDELGVTATGRTRTSARGATTRYTPERITPPTTPGGQTSPSAATVEALTGEEPQVIVIESINSLLVNATVEQHLRIATIIGYVDSEPEEASTNYVVYPLENQDPEDLAKVLNQLIQETVENKDPSGKVVGTTVTKKTEEEITIIPDKNTFSIIVYASKKNQQWVESLIKQLDRRRPQVLIDVTLVEISKNDDFTLALDLVTKHPSIPLVGNLEKIALIDPNENTGRRVWGARSTSGAGGTAFYADRHVQALLTAVSNKGYGRVLAKPKLLVNDNELGTIQTKEIQTIVSPQTTVIPGTGISQPTAAVSIINVPYIAEIKLDITPHISEGDLLRLEIQMTRTDFRARPDYALNTSSGPLTGPTPPDLLTSDVKTVITVPDESTIILGGLEKLNQIKSGTKIPILGDLPLIGGLFRNTDNTDAQSRLYVFVKANILRPEEKGIESDIVRISDKNRVEFEKHEKEMQDYEDWPGIKSKPMDPKKVLDADSK